MSLVERTSLNIEFGRQNFLIYGSPGIGKTTLVSQWPNSVIVFTEPGFNFIDNIPHVQGFLGVEKILEFTEDLFKSPSEYKEYSTIVIDTADGLNNLCVDYILKKTGKKFIQEIPHGIGWDKLAQLIRGIVGNIIKSGRNVVFTSHEFSKELKFEARERTKIAPNFNKKTREAILHFVDFVGYMYLDERTDRNNPKRAVMFQAAADYETKNRGGVFPKKVLLEPENKGFECLQTAYKEGLVKFKEKENAE